MSESVEQLKKLLKIAEDNFGPERYTNVEKMYEHLAERAVAAPASAKEHYHYAFPGGYLDHVHNVIRAMVPVAKAAKTMGMKIDFTKEEAIFAAMHHDLGKLGDVNHPYYIPQSSDWHRENRGETYSQNPELVFMTTTDRTFFLLQHFGVTITDKEFKAIKMADGLYVDTNKPYFISYHYPPPVFHTNLGYILHWADHMSALGEKDQFLHQES
jgi:hypothetical protein